MKITFLGTGAADWNGKYSEKSENRFYSSALIDGVLLIDPGPHIFISSEIHGIDLSNVKYVINTHSHSDHFCIESLRKLEKSGAEFIPFLENETREFGGYRVSSFRANHGTCTDAVHFLICDGKKSLYYALDGAWLMYDEIEALKKGTDAIVLDCTVGEQKGDYRIFEHNNIRMVNEMKETMKPYVKKFMASHFAKTLHKDRKELEKALSSFGIKAAYDGLTEDI